MVVLNVWALNDPDDGQTNVEKNGDFLLRKNKTLGLLRKLIKIPTDVFRFFSFFFFFGSDCSAANNGFGFINAEVIFRF